MAQKQTQSKRGGSRPNAGRKRSSNVTRPIGIRVNIHTLNRLKAAGVNIAQQVQDYLEQLAENYPDPENTTTTNNTNTTAQ